jgi:hypothetical protein
METELEGSIPMVTSQGQRWAAWGGIAFLVLQMAAQGLMQVGGMEPAFDADAGEILGFFESRDEQLFAIGSYLHVLSFAPFLFFLGALWTALRAMVDDGSPLPIVAVGSGVAFLGSLSVGWGIAMLRIDGLSPETAQLAFDIGNLGFANAWVPLGAMLLATSFAAHASRGLPGWVTWLGFIAGFGLLAARAAWTSPVAFAPYVLFWIWLVATGVVLVRRSRTTSTS